MIKLAKELKVSILAKIRTKLTALKKIKSKTVKDSAAIETGIDSLTFLSIEIGEFIASRDLTKLKKGYGEYITSR